jgi:hypothetical protein
MDDADATWLRRAATWIAGASIVLVVVNGALVLKNQDAQRIVNQRQAQINQAAQIARVNQLIIETIARTAIARKDDTLTALLERHGVKLHPSSTTGGSTP